MLGDGTGPSERESGVISHLRLMPRRKPRTAGSRCSVRLQKPTVHSRFSNRSWSPSEGYRAKLAIVAGRVLQRYEGAKGEESSICKLFHDEIRGLSGRGKVTKRIIARRLPGAPSVSLRLRGTGLEAARASASQGRSHRIGPNSVTYRRLRDAGPHPITSSTSRRRRHRPRGAVHRCSRPTHVTKAPHSLRRLARSARS